MELFISLQDPRQRPKGTRDPLGFEQIWTLYGREVVNGLTTITSSLDNFIVALLGFYISGSNESDDKEKLFTFMRYEQLAAYLRLESQKNPNILGITRVKKYKDTNNMVLSKNNQILSSQASYGLWGLYSTALADVSSIKNRQVLEPGMKIIHLIMNKHKDVFTSISSKVSKDGGMTSKYVSKYAELFKDMLEDKEIRKELLSQLLSKSNIYNFMLENEITVTDEKNHKKLKNVMNFCHDIMEKSHDEDLKMKIDNILKIDLIMKIGNKLFDTVRNSDFDTKSLDDYVKEIEHIDFPKLELPSKTKNIHYLTDVTQFIAAMNNKNYKKAVTTIININKKIMQKRDSIAWVSIEKNLLKTRVKTHKTISEVENIKGMEYNYFMYSYLNIAWQLKKVS